jgi:hypothetical protein
MTLVIDDTTNLISYLYEIIDENFDFINDLSAHDNNSTFSLTPIDDYIKRQPCATNYYTFIKKFLSNMTYVTCKEFIDIIDKNINDLIKLIDSGAIPILILGHSQLVKSNSFYNLYFLNELRKKGHLIHYAYDNVNSVLALNDEYTDIRDELGIDKDKNIILIYCDDISYSGDQLSKQIAPYDKNLAFSRIDGGKPAMILNPKIKYFINLVGILPIALTRIREEFANNNLIVPTNIIKFEGLCTTVRAALVSCGEYRKNDCIILTKSTDNEIKISSMLDYYFMKYEVRSTIQTNMLSSLVYPFHKYPDAQSTFGNLCRIKGIKNNEKIINVEKFINKFCGGNMKIFNTMSDNIFTGNFNIFLTALGCGNPRGIISKLVRDWDDNTKFVGDVDADLDWICISNDVTESANLLHNENGGYIKIINSDTITSEPRPIFTCYTKSIVSFYKRGYNYKKYKYAEDVDKKWVIQLFHTFVNMCNELNGGYTNIFSGNEYNKYLKYKTKYIALKKKLSIQ